MLKFSYWSLIFKLPGYGISNSMLPPIFLATGTFGCLKILRPISVGSPVLKSREGFFFGVSFISDGSPGDLNPAGMSGNDIIVFPSQINDTNFAFYYINIRTRTDEPLEFHEELLQMIILLK